MRIALDLDGVLARGASNWPDYKDCVPVEGAVEALSELRRYGVWIIIYTARLPEDREVTERWLYSQGFLYNELVMGKPIADLYLDDKGEKFTSWQKSLEGLRLHLPE